MAKKTYKKISYVFDPLKGRKVVNKAEVLEEIAELIKDRMLEDISEQKSPVTGRKWPSIKSKEHAAAKGSSSADLDFTGEMLDKLKVEVKGNKIKVHVDSLKKAVKGRVEGHNQHDPSLKHPLPKRQFIPKGSQNFRRDILDEVNEIVEENEAEQITEGAASRIKSFQQILRELSGGTSDES